MSHRERQKNSSFSWRQRRKTNARCATFGSDPIWLRWPGLSKKKKTSIPTDLLSDWPLPPICLLPDIFLPCWHLVFQLQPVHCLHDDSLRYHDLEWSAIARNGGEWRWFSMHSMCKRHISFRPSMLKSLTSPILPQKWCGMTHPEMNDRILIV